MYGYPQAGTKVKINDVNSGRVRSVKDIDISLNDGTNPVTPTSVTIVGNDIEIEVPASAVIPVGATLIKTGQTTSYRTGDDGDLEAGRGASFLVLGSNNPFGNTNRFTDELGGSTYANNWVIDWSTYNGSTVLGYFRTVQAATIWDTAIDNSLGTFGTFANCRLPNRKEIENLNNFGVANPLNYSPINIPNGNLLWTSTTLFSFTTQAYYCDSFIGTVANNLKTTNYKYIPVRTFTVTGTTLT